MEATRDPPHPTHTHNEMVQTNEQIVSNMFRNETSEQTKVELGNIIVEKGPD